jgi:hypothetical protein
MYELRCTMYDFREGTQMELMIMISADHDHHNHLRSLSAFQSLGFPERKANFAVMERYEGMSPKAGIA